MAPAQIPVFLTQKPSTENGINRATTLFLAWLDPYFACDHAPLIRFARRPLLGGDLLAPCKGFPNYLRSSYSRSTTLMQKGVLA